MDQVRLETARLELERLERERGARRREELIRQIVSQVVKPHPELPPETTSAARAAAEAALAGLPELQLLFQGWDLARDARDRVYGLALEAQRQEIRRRQEEAERRQTIAPPPPPEPPPPPAPAAAPAAPLIAPPPAPAPIAEAGNGQARKKDALVQRGVDRVEQDLDLHDDLDLATRAEIWDRVVDQLEERLTGSEDAADADQLADELLAEEFGDEPDEDDDEGS